MRYTVTSEHTQRELTTQGTIGVLLGLVALAFGPIGWIFAVACWYTAAVKLGAATRVMGSAIEAGEETR